MPEPDYTSPLWESSALVVIDIQNDFLESGASPIAGTSEVINAVAKLTEHYRSQNKPIAHIVRLYEPFSSDVDLPRRADIEGGVQVVAPNSKGSQIPTAVLPMALELDAELLLDGGTQQVGGAEAIFFKPRWSAFFRTALDQWLRDREVTTVVIAGCNLPNCPRATLFDASERDYRTVLVRDAVSQVSDERLTDLERIGVLLATTENVCASVIDADIDAR